MTLLHYLVFAQCDFEFDTPGLQHSTLLPDPHTWKLALQKLPLRNISHPPFFPICFLYSRLLSHSFVLSESFLFPCSISFSFPPLTSSLTLYHLALPTSLCHSSFPYLACTFSPPLIYSTPSLLSPGFPIFRSRSLSRSTNFPPSLLPSVVAIFPPLRNLDFFVVLYLATLEVWHTVINIILSSVTLISDPLSWTEC